MRTSQEKAYRYIKDAILNVELKPGQRLPTETISRELRLSRTPVREALSKLEHEGLVVRTDGWGYMVKPATVKEAMEVYTVRASLEVEVVKHLTPRITSDGIERLRGTLQKAEQALRRGRTHTYRDHTRSFYAELARQADNECLALILASLNDRIRWFGAIITDRHLERPQEALVENREVLAAIEARDPDAAERAMRSHILKARESFRKYAVSDAITLAA